MKVTTHVAPGLLLSTPQLSDPHFARAVILMVEHNDEGSFGLILNRPSNMSVGELMEALDISWQGDPTDRVMTGGPVMPTSGWVIHESTDLLEEGDDDLQSALENGGTLKVGAGLSLSTSTENLRALAASPPERTRFVLGYAGWGPGQLAEEMAQGSWIHVPLEPEIVFDCDPGDMWSAALSSIGVDPEAIVPSRGIH